MKANQLPDYFALENLAAGIRTSTAGRKEAVEAENAVRFWDDHVHVDSWSLGFVEQVIATFDDHVKKVRVWIAQWSPVWGLNYTTLHTSKKRTDGLTVIASGLQADFQVVEWGVTLHITAQTLIPIKASCQLETTCGNHSCDQSTVNALRQFDTIRWVNMASFTHQQHFVLFSTLLIYSFDAAQHEWALHNSEIPNPHSVE